MQSSAALRPAPVRQCIRFQRFGLTFRHKDFRDSDKAGTSLSIVASPCSKRDGIFHRTGGIRPPVRTRPLL